MPHEPALHDDVPNDPVLHEHAPHPSPSRRRPRPLPLLAALAAALLLVLLGALPASAQYFGRNKVLWEDFDFHKTPTEHFDVYYYPEDHPAADELSRMAERWNARISAALQHELTDRKPLIFYADQPDFRQTTLTRGLIGEGVGGFTEPLRNRVVLPIAGTLAETDHVLGHELVHAFQFDLANALADASRNAGLGNLPLWMVEGMAEYLSKGRSDPLTSLWMRDALLNDELPTFEQMNRMGKFNPYRFGEAFYAYVAGRWDDFTVARLFATSITLGPTAAFQDVLGMAPEEVFEDWHEATREAYGPILEERRDADEVATLLLGEDTLRGRINIAPALSPDGTRLAFLSTRDLFTLDLYLADARTGKVQRKLVSSRGNPHFDALRFLDSAGAWSPDGSRFAFAVFTRGDNALAIVDTDRGGVVKRYRPPVGALANPAWSPDGRHVAFTGTVNGLADLYLLDLESGETRQLTDDPYADLQSAFSPDGRFLAFVTERGPGTDLQTLAFGPPNLALYDLDTGNVQVLEIFPEAKHIDPQFSPDGRYLYFVSDPDGVPDVFRYELQGARVERLTELKTGVTGITELSPALSVASDSGEVAFSVYRDFRYSIYTLPESPARSRVPVDARPGRRAALLPPLPGQLGQPPADTVALYLERPEAGLPPALEPGQELAATDYDSKLGLTYVGPPTIGVGVDRYGFGLGGSVSAYFSDLLNRHEVGVVLQGGSSSGDFGGSFGGQVSYLNQTSRLGWGGVFTHLPFRSTRTRAGRTVVDVDGQQVVADVVEQLRETVTVDELSTFARYPLNRNQRFEATVGASLYSFDRELEQLVVVGNRVISETEQDLGAPDDLTLYRGGLAFVGDSTIYGFAAPIRGARYRFEVEGNGGDLDFQTALADYRRYLFRRPVTLAFRGLHYGRYGDDGESSRLTPLYVGRQTYVRGYGVDDIALSECTVPEGEAAEDVGCPEFDRLVGSRIAVAGVELRVPLLGIEGYGLFELPWLPTELVLFAEGGAAWTDAESVDLRFDRDTTDRVPVFSAGVAARTVLGGYLPLEFYYAYPFQRPDQDWEFGFVVSPGW